MLGGWWIPDWPGGAAIRMLFQGSRVRVIRPRRIVVRSKLLLVLVLGLGFTVLAGAEEAKVDVKKELAKLEGTWQAASIMADGKELPAEARKQHTLMIKDGKFTYTMGKEVLEGKLQLDPSKSPKTVDSMRTEGAAKGTTRKGIYELTDTTFQVCFAPVGKERPTEFTAKAGTGNNLAIWKKVK
jgi:uncharacterized protein (TIGR03067 family)